MNRFMGRCLSFFRLGAKARLNDTINNERRNTQSIFDTAPVGMFIVDMDFKLVRANQVIMDMFRIDDISKYQYHCEFMCGLSRAKVFTKAGNCPFSGTCPLHKAIQYTIETGRPNKNFETEHNYLLDDKVRSLWLGVSTKKIDLDYRPHVLVIAEDITARKFAEKAIHDAEKFSSNVLDCMPAHIAVLNRAGNIIRTNFGWQKFAEQNTDQEQNTDYLGLNYLDVCKKAKGPDEESAQKCLTGLKDLLGLKSEHFSMEYPCHSRERKRWFMLRAVPLNVPDGGVLVSHIDITDRKIIEQQMSNMNQQLEMAIEKANEMTRQALSSSKAKSDFLANMSHEIRTPLSGIIGMLELSLDEYLSDEVRENLTTARTSADILLGIINDILDISKIEAGRISVELVDVTVGELLTDIEYIAKERAAKKDVEFVIVFDSPVPARITTDPMRLRQCLFNLVGNALKFTEQGIIRLRLSYESANRMITFEVQDTGIGIEADKQRVVFEAFEQGDPNVVRKYGGTGLGLAITSKLVNLLGGKVALQSEPGKGSTFTISVPAGQPSAQMLESIDPGLVKPSPKKVDFRIEGKILIVEDDQVNQKTIGTILYKAGVDFEIAVDGIDALEKYFTDKFDLVLMDMHMPRMDGYEATTKLRRRGCTVPIIALTASVMKSDTERYKQIGCDAFLAKPVNRVNLLETIEKYIRLSRDKNNTLHQKELRRSRKRAERKERSETVAPIDQEDLKERFDSEALIIDVIDAFFEDNPARLRQLAAAVEQSDSSRITELSHAIKGSSATISAIELSRAASKLNIAAKKGQTELYRKLYEKVYENFNRLCGYVQTEPSLEKVRTPESLLINNY